MEGPRKRKRRMSIETKRWLILFVAALAISVVAAIIGELVDKPVPSYYPHDDERASVTGEDQ